MARRVKTVSFSLPMEIVEMLERGAADAHISKSSYVSMLLSQLLNERGADNAECTQDS